MKSPKSRAAELLREKQSERRKAAIFFGLALLVILCTAAVLLLHAQAMTHTRRVLECAYVPHQHTEACYPDGDMSAQPICGLADAVVHVHNEDCYDEAGALACPLEELEPHTHDDSCLVERRELICGLDGIDEADLPDASASAPSGVHTHTESCYAPGERVLVCGQEERAPHTHTDACYAGGEPVLICGLAEGVPSGAPAEEDEPQHIHTEECYRVYTELGCGKLELHTHTEECYMTVEPENPEEEPYEVLVCTIPQLEEHVHSEECFTTVELTPEEVAALEQQGTPIEDLQLVYEDADVRVTVDYDTTALIPEGAALALVDAAAPMPDPTPVLLAGAERGEADANSDPSVSGAPETDAPAPDASGPDMALPDAPVPDTSVPDTSVPDTSVPDSPEPEPLPESAPDPAPESGMETSPEPAPESNSDTSPDVNPEENAEGAPSATAPSVFARGENTDSALVRAGFMAEGREWLPASTATYTVQYLENGLPLGEPVQYAYTPGGELPVFPRAIARFTRECRTDDFVVTASYTALAAIPEEAELRAALVTDEAVVAEHESEYRAALHSDQARMISLMDIGFWLDGEEIQPAAPVTITVQLLGEDGLPVGEPLTVVHFAQTGAEVLRTDVDESGAATFDMNGFSLVGLGYTPESDEQGRVTLDHTFEWTDENGLFRATFHIKGVAGPYAPADAAVEPDNADDGTADGDTADGSAADAPAADEDNDNADGENTGAQQGENDVPGAQPDASAGAPEEDAGNGADASEDAGNADADTSADTSAAEDLDKIDAPLANEAYLDFSVETLGEDDAAYAAYAEYSAGNADALLDLAVLRYALTYGGEALDLSACEIEVTIEPTERMEQAAAEYQRDNPADNGDDDGDGYVLAADGETLLPAPATETSVLLSAVAPAALEDGQPLAEQGTVALNGQASAARANGADASAAGVSNADAPAAGVPGTDAPSADEPGTDASAENGVERANQAVTFSIQPNAAQTPETANTIGTGVSLSVNPRYTVQYYARLPKADLTYKTIEEANAHNVDLLPAINTNNGGTGNGGNLPENGPTTNIASNNATEQMKLLINRIVGTQTDQTYKPHSADGANNNFGLVYIPIDKTGEKAGKVAASTEPIETYREKQFNYLNAPELIYTDMLISNKHYKPDELWVLKCDENGNPLPQNQEENWIVYTDFRIESMDDGYEKEEIKTPDGIMYIRYRYRAQDKDKKEVLLSFTNRPNTPDYAPYTVNGGKITYIPLSDQSVLRWVYQAGTEEQEPINAMFHDYDIGQRTGNDKELNTEAYGINHPRNRTTTTTDEQDPPNKKTTGKAVYAFGNANTGVRYKNHTWNRYKINQKNRVGGWPNSADISYGGSVFKMVTGINSDGSKVVFDSGISAPTNLFGSGEAIGKTTLNGNVTFARNGDTYTLQAANVVNEKGESISSISNLDKMVHPSAKNEHKNMWTNNFWAMDGVVSNADYPAGAGNTISIQSPYRENNEYLPASDDGGNHNYYFGMQFQVDFELTDRYVGPLDYLFYGDDDLWVFLSKVGDDGKIIPWDGNQQYGKLVCDLGGVRQSVGEYTNLWDYIPGGKDGTRETQKYRLSFFYTERGASGSACWMQFTLPNVTSPKVGEATPENNYGSLEIQKQVFRKTVDGKDDKDPVPFDNGDVFWFQINLTQGSDQKEELPINLNYTLYTKREDGGEDVSNNHVTFNGGIVPLKHNQRIVIENLPVGTTFEVIEVGARTPSVQSTEPLVSNYTYDTEVFAGQVNGMTGTGGKTIDLKEIGAVTQDWTEKTYSRMISANQTEVVKFKNTYRVYNLPKTGGGVTPEWYVLGGGALVLATAAILHKRRKRARAAP